MISTVNIVITDKLFLDDPGLIGCRRRGRWSYQEDQPWRMVRGNSLLAVVGEKVVVYTPVGELEYFELDSHILQFRGGPWNLDWVEDMYDLWSLVVMYQGDPKNTIIVLHENKGELDIKEVKVPDTLNSRVRVDKILAEYNSDPPGRIPKSGERALRICPHCPYKQRCDSEDILRGETDDWSPSYPTP